MPEGLLPIGKIGKTHGLKGALTGKLNPDFALSEDFNIEEPVYLEIDKDPVPFFLEWIQEDDDRFRLKFDSIHRIEEAQPFVGKEVLVDQKFMEELDESFEFENFEVIDAESTSIGTIEQLVEMGLNILLEVRRPDSTTVLLPFDEALILTIDREKKQLQLQIAEGLLDL